MNPPGTLVSFYFRERGFGQEGDRHRNIEAGQKSTLISTERWFFFASFQDGEAWFLLIQSMLSE